MENRRSDNLSIYKMKQEINSAINILKFGRIHKRSMRQIADGEAFLEMLNRSPYRNCKTVSDVKRKLKKERAKLKKQLTKIDENMPGHQITVFENVQEISEQERIELNNLKQQLHAQIRWLHKCLGMCSNKNYFN